MQMVQNLLTSIKKSNKYEGNNFFMSPSVNNLLQDQMQQLQLLSQQELVQRLKAKKQQVVRQSQEIGQNCHNYFMDLTSVLMETENKIKNDMDKQTLNFLQQIERRIDEIRDNQQSYNSSSQTYQTLKMLSINYTETQQSIEEVGKMLQKCYSISLQGLSEHGSEIGMSTNKIYLSNSEFITTCKKTHGNTFEVSEREFELTLGKFQERQQKQMLLNQRLKNKVKSLEQMLSKKGVNIKELNKLNSAQNERYSKDFWDLELERVKGENSILTEEINNISQKLITLTGENEALKVECKKMIQSNISQLSNPKITIYQSYQGLTSEDNSRLISNLDSYNLMHSQTLIHNKQAREENQNSPSSCLVNNYHNSMQNEILLEYEKKNEQLSLELTKKMKQLEEMRHQSSNNVKQIACLKQLNEQKQNQLQRLSHHCQTLEHDYEVSSKKKFQLEERITLLKQSLKETQQKQNSIMIENQLRFENLQTMLKLKEQTITNQQQSIQQKLKSEYQTSLQQLKHSKQIIERELTLCRNLITETKNQSQLKTQKFKEEFKKLQKTINSKDEELATLRQEIYQLNKLNQQQNQLNKEENTQTYKEKYENHKKESMKFKKQLKQKTKEMQNLKTENIKMSQFLGIKCAQMNNRLEIIVREMQKNKGLYESKIKVCEERQRQMREKYEFNMNEIMSQTQGKKGNFNEIIQRYIQAMSNFCSKNAEVKKLKEENRDLKSNKSIIMKGSRKQLSRDIEGATRSLQNSMEEISELQRGLLQDRLKVQKGIAEQKYLLLMEDNKLLNQKLLSKEASIKEIQDQLHKLKKEIKKYEDSAKRESSEQKLITQNNSLQQRVQKLQTELKSWKNQHKKSQDQLTQLQNQLKKKKDHITNVKKQLTSNTDQVEELNFMLKNKSQQIQKLKRQLKDQSTKQTLLNQMKDKMEEYNKLQETNEDLKKQIQKLNVSYKFQASKLQAQIKELKAEKRDQLSQKVNTKTTQLNDQLSDLKSKNKKLKTELDRKESLLQNLKTKQESQTKDIQSQLQQTLKQLTKKNKEIEANQKKIEILNLNQRKFKQRSKLLTVVIKKVYAKIIKEKQNVTSRPKSSINNKNKDNNSYLLQNTSPITRVFSSNVFNSTVSPLINSHKDHHTLETLAEVDINLEDLEKYSEGLEMFGVNPFELKTMQTGHYNVHNQISTFSQFIGSPDGKYETMRNRNTQCQSKSPPKNSKAYSPVEQKQKVQQLLDCLSEKEQLDVGEIINFFDKVIEGCN